MTKKKQIACKEQRFLTHMSMYIHAWSDLFQNKR